MIGTGRTHRFPLLKRMGMIIDVHTHYWDMDREFGPQVTSDCRRAGGDPETLRTTSEGHLQATAAVDAAIVFGLAAQATGWNVKNETVAEQCARAPDRLVFFASVDPVRDDYMDELEKCHHQLRCKGLKLGPVYQGVHPLERRYRDIYAYAQKHHLPIMIHMATTYSSGVPLDFARPAHMDQVACEYPDLRIIMPHLGHPWMEETIAAIRKQPNLYADLSALYYRPWQFYNAMRILVEYHAEGKVFFGSDYPFTLPADSLAGVRNVNHILGNSSLPEIPAQAVEDIINRDALSILEISFSD